MSMFLLIFFLIPSLNTFAQTPKPFPNDPRITFGNSGTPIYWVGDPDGEPSEHFLNLRAAWSITTGNPAVKVAVISNGVDWNQSDLPANNYLGYNWWDNNNNTSASCFGNTPVSGGTIVNSIIFSKTNNNEGVFSIAGGWGSTPGVTPIVYKSFNMNLSSTNHINDVYDNLIPPLLSSINSAVSAGAKVIVLPHSICDVTYSRQQAFNEAIQTILDDPCNQVTIIACAGDWSDPYQDNPILFPGICDRLITVGGVNSDHEIGYHESRYGQHLDFVAGYAAPANYGNACMTGGWDQYNAKGSTLVSAAQLAGVVALMYSVNPNLRQDDVFEILKQSCYKTDVYTDYVNGWSPHVGYGFPNAKIAVELARDFIGSPVVSGTWNTNQVKGSFTIESGTTLTLSGMTLSMLPGAIITIKPGGKLIANNSIITDYCDKMWNGFQVWGDKTKTQVPYGINQYYQGYLELNNSTIENALCAADLWKPNDYSKTGGILRATNTNFVNNTRSIHALSYRNMHPTIPNRELGYTGYCTNCTFTIDANYMHEKTFYKHIDIADINGFNFSNCDFSLAKNVPGVDYTSCSAIASYSAKFTVTGNGIPVNQSSFTGFSKAVNVLNNYDKIRTFTINNASFIDNKQGVYANKFHNSTIINSNFQIGFTPGGSGCTTNASYGINLELCPTFAIEDNTFQKLTGAPAGLYNGINITDSKTMNSIYRNTFTGLSYANLAQLKNWQPNDQGNYQDGLTYFCNTNTNNYADFFVVPDGDPQKISGIGDHQGNSNLVAGNKFSQSTSTLWHFFNGGDYRVGYYYNVSQPLENPDDNKIEYVTQEPKQLSNSCPSHYGGTGGISIELGTAERAAKELQFALALSNYNSVKALFDNLKDGGSTSQTLTDIETAQPQDMWALRSELLGASPHLSIEVLKAVAGRTDVFPPSAIFDILAANPDELRKNELIDYLATTQDPLPEYMINILRSVAEGSSYKTVLLDQMSQYNRERSDAANDIIRSILNKDETDYNDLRNWLDNLGGPEADRQIIASYLNEDNFTAALNLAGMLPQLYAFNAAEIADNAAMIQLITLYQTLYNEGRQPDALNQTEQAMLTAMAATYPSESGGIARNILSAYYGATYPECFELPETAAYKKGQLTPEVYADIYRMQIDVNPNPANIWAAFDYRLPDFESSGLLEITDLSGHVLLTKQLTDAQGQYLLDTRELAAGVYFYTLSSGKARKTGKFVVTK